jgi:hypothetical protein
VSTLYALRDRPTDVPDHGPRFKNCTQGRGSDRVVSELALSMLAVTGAFVALHGHRLA